MTSLIEFIINYKENTKKEFKTIKLSDLQLLKNIFNLVSYVANS